MINDALRLLRTFSGMSQTEVAEKVGVTKSWISEIESKRKTPTLQLLESYSRAFDIPLSSIMFFSENMKKPDLSDKARLFLSKKIVAILDYIAASREDIAHEEAKESSST